MYKAKDESSGKCSLLTSVGLFLCIFSSQAYAGTYCGWISCGAAPHGCVVNDGKYDVAIVLPGYAKYGDSKGDFFTKLSRETRQRIEGANCACVVGSVAPENSDYSGLHFTSVSSVSDRDSSQCAGIK